MKIFVNEKGQVTNILDGTFVANAAWIDNVVRFYYGGNNSDISYCNISFIRADGMKLLNYMATVGEDDEGIFWELEISETSGILAAAGQLQISAQFVKAHYSSGVIIRREIISSVTVASFVQKNIGETDTEEHNRILDEVTTIRDQLVGISNDHESRITAIEDANPLVDFVSNISGGYGTKYYYDGTTATVPLATGSSVPGPDVTPLAEITFVSGNWVLDEGGDYELAFSPLTTSRDDNRFIASIDEASGDGYEQTAATIFKGSDGSILLFGVATPFNGRVLLSGGTVQVVNTSGDTNVIEAVQRNGIGLAVVDKTVNVLVPDTAYDLAYNDTTVGDTLDEIDTAIGDISIALDTINGEVI